MNIKHGIFLIYATTADMTSCVPLLCTVLLSYQCLLGCCISLSIDSRIISCPSKGCSGPYVIEMMKKTCLEDSVSLMTKCISACIERKCCRAGRIQRNFCQMNNKLDSTFDFIKHLPQQTPVCYLGKYQLKLLPINQV